MRRFLLGCVLLATAISLAAQAGQAAPPQAKVRFAQAGDDRIAWYERGSGPPLVMAIGTGSTMAEWDPALLRLLAQNHRLILFDYPGIGRSSKLDGDETSFADLADTTADFMDAIGLDQADVLGWSMGGFVMQQLAIRHPESVRRLILAATNPGGDHAVLGDDDDQDADSDPDPSEAQVISILYPRTPAGRAEGRAFFDRLDTASESGEIPDDFDVPASTVLAQVAAEDPWLRSNANSNALTRLRMPALVTAGRRDRVTPPANARWIAGQIPGARLEIFDDAHAFLFSERAEFVRLVDDFLD
jgi:pimeloyl-ACP methyl ester carboxylesterase